MVKVTVDSIRKIAPKCAQPDILARHLQTMSDKYDIKTNRRFTYWVATMMVESGGFTVFKENLNYSANRLCVVWPNRFDSTNAPYYANNPERLANKVYAGRNGNTEPGDGFKYLGRGAIQLTGKANYKKFQDKSGIPAVEHPTLLENYPSSIESAAWFWWANNVNHYADKGDVEGARKAVNGGRHGIKEFTVYIGFIRQFYPYEKV